MADQLPTLLPQLVEISIRWGVAPFSARRHPVLLVFNAEKAFNNVKWCWLGMVLDKMNMNLF